MVEKDPAEPEAHGSAMTGDSRQLYLSDSFSMGRGSGCLECTCRVLNIRRGHNGELMGKCRRLWEYSEFVSEIEAGMQTGLSRQEAVQSAIDRCIERDILTDVLRKEKSEVLRMSLLTEYDEKKHLRHTFEEGRAEGLAEGREEGRAEGREATLLDLIRKKTAKGKSPEVIAEELEEDAATIREFLRKL